MRAKEFLNQLDHERIVAAIRDAEQKTSGDIRVYISHRKIEDVMDAAAKRFHKLGMHKTRHRNAVLIFLAPRTQRFAILGDAAIHEKCGDAFWQEETREMTTYLKNGEPLTAILNAVARLGSRLATEFPRQADDKDNELPDEIVEDSR